MTIGDWDQRQLCSDGACIGVIGPAGTCKVCGRAAANWGEERTRGMVTDGSDADEDGADEDDDEDEGGDEDGEPDRALCPDGGCIGVIGADGRCKVCGKSGAPVAAAASETAATPVDEPEPERRLCADGACVGVIGADGTCNRCGKAAE